MLTEIPAGILSSLSARITGDTQHILRQIHEEVKGYIGMKMTNTPSD